ncbi:hypothetical protein [Streptomyces sp. NPDC088812]|uniref:hypothetical protein n=1 Tax=Streptomyces sp. NPDC088812 TaxID=3365905 RepID=UPI00382C0E25
MFINASSRPSPPRAVHRTSAERTAATGPRAALTGVGTAGHRNTPALVATSAVVPPRTEGRAATRHADGGHRPC